MADIRASADPSLLQNLKLHLEGLKRTEHGLILYNQIQRGLQQYGDKDGRIELIFVTFMHALLGKYAKSTACDPATRVKARLIQQRLTLYLPEKSTAVPVTAPATTPVSQPPAPAKPVIPPPVVAKPPLPQEPPPPPPKPAIQPPPIAPMIAARPEPVAAVVKTVAVPVPLAPPPVMVSPPPVSAPPPEKPMQQDIPATPAAASAVESEATPAPSEAPPPPSAEPRPTRQKKLEELEDTFAGNVTASIAADKQFGQLLEQERAALQDPQSPLGEFNDMKQILVKGLNELIEERKALIEKLSSASEYLKSVESDRERLRTELGQARKHSMADDLTGLPRREVFIKQLEAEIGRVKRYGFSLTLAVIDVDNLEAVNKRYGRTAGDAVLRCYASEILSKFRTYDLVARYGGDEFAVLFPNTQKDGAMQALEKARRTATSTYINQDGKNIPLPSFSSVLTQYSSGEPVTALLQRADETLSQAKLSGRNRMVVALPTS